MTSVTLLLPELRRLAPFAAAGTIARWLSRGDGLPNAAPGRDVALRECFEFLGADVPYAALTRQLDMSDAAHDVWINCDAAFVVADAVTLRMLACGTLDIDAEQSAELLKPLRRLFGDAGFPLDISTSGRWQLRCPKQTRLPHFSPPHDVLGDDLARHLPAGDNEKQWRHLLNEAQVILHNHAVNARRAQNGLTPVNSLWFWGAGALPDWVRSTFDRVVSADPVVLALAKLAGVVSERDVAEQSFDRASASKLLIDADDAVRLDAFVEAIDKGIVGKRIDNLRILSADGSRAIYRHAHRRRFWRSVKSLSVA